MDKIKKKKTNKKRGKTHALSIGNLRKTELNCAQCQKQLFGLWKNESFQSCLECSSKKSNVLSMLKSMNRVCEVRVNNQVMDNTVLMRTLSNEGTEMEQSKDEENDYIGRNIEMNEKRYARDSENKNVSPDFKEEKIAQRTRRRSLNLRNQTDEYKDNCKSNHVSNDPKVSINNDKLSSNNGKSNVTENVESGQSKAGDSIIKTRRKSSLAKMALEESPRSDVTVDFESIQENTRSKRGRPLKRHTQLSVESNLNENKISLQSGNRRRQQLPVEKNSSSKLAKGKKKGKESEEVENDDSSSIAKMSKHEPELHVENKDCDTKDKNINFGESRKRRQSSAFKEVVPSESLYEEIYDNRNLRKSGRIHHSMSPEDKGCDDKNEKRNQTDEILFKQRSIVNRNEMKRLKIDMENYHVSGIERVKRRSSRASQNTSPNNNKNLDKGSVDGSRRRTRASLNVITDKTTMETEPAKCTVLDDRLSLSSTTQGLEHHSEDEKQQEDVIKEKKLSETELLSKERRKKQRGKRPIKPKLKPPIPARTLELLRSTRGLKPVVLVEKMITVKRKVAHQPARNEKKGRFLVDQNKKRTVRNFNKKYGTSNAEILVADKTENKTISVSEKNRKVVSKEDNNIDSKQACEPKQKLMTLRRLRDEEYNQNKLLKLNRNNVRKNKGRRKMQVIKKYQSMRMRKSKKKKKTSGTEKMRMTVSKETKQIPRYFPCEKCKKQFVNVLQQKAHELTHRGYFELKLKRIDSYTIQKTEGEIISKDIVNYILKSVFSTETDNISEVCRDEICDSIDVQPSDHTDVHSDIPEETYNATGTRKYELRQVKVILKRIDLREAIAMNKCNESVLVATSIVNNILQNIDDKTVEGCIYTQHEVVNVDSASNYNKTKEAEFYVSELEENNSDEHFSQEFIGKTHLERQGVEIIDTDPNCEETANQSWERKHSENHNEIVDNSEVISNNGSEQDKHENNHMLESEDIDNINEGAEIDATESSENQLHRNIDYNKHEHYNDKSAERTDNDLDRNLLIKTDAFNNGKLYSMSSNISNIIKNEGIETLNAKTSTPVDSSTEFLEDTDTFETSKDNETDSAVPDACNVHIVENEDNTSNEIEEITMNTSAGESDKSPDDADRRIYEYSDIMSTTRSEYNEKMVCGAGEVDNELHKEEVENGKSSELLNVTSNEEVYSLAVTSDVDKADSDNSSEDYDCGGSDTTIQTNADTSESQQSGDEVDIVETNKSLSVCSSDDNSKSGDISFESSVVTNADNNDEVLSEGKESTVSDSDKMICKDKQSIVSIQDESSVSKLDACEYINERDCSETSSEKSYVAADSSETMNEQTFQNENGADEVGGSKNYSQKIFNEDQVITKPDNYKAYSCDMENDKPENSEIADKSDDIVFNKPCKQEVQQTHTSLHNKENSKSVSDNDTINDVALTHISANIENCYAICKQETNSMFMKTHSSDEHHILALSETSDKSDAVVSQNTDTTTTTQHDSLETKHFNIPQDNIKNETNLNKLKNVGDSSSEFVDDIENKSSTGVEEEDESRDRTISDGSDSQIFMTTQPSDNEETILHNASNNFVEIKITEGNDSEIDNENKRIIENTLENDAASESNYKSMEKYLESFIKDFIVRSTERNETNTESNNQIKEEKLGVNEEIEKLIADATPKEDTCSTNTTSDYDVETEKSGIDVVLTDGRCTSNTASDYVVTEKSGINVIPTEGNSTSDYEAVEKTEFYNDSLQNMTGMLFEDICLSSNMERKSQNANQKEPLTQTSAAVMTKNQIQLSSREETNDHITGTEAAGDMYRLSGNKSEIASPASYVSDTTAMTNCRLSVNDITKPNAVGQFCQKSVTDFSATMEYSMSNTQPTDVSNTQPTDVSNTQKQSSNINSTQRRHSSDFSNTQRQLSSMNNTQRQSSIISNSQRQSSDMSSSQRQSSDRVQTALPSSSNHITFTIQKQSCDRRDPDLTGTSSSSHIDHSRRYSGDRWQTESSSDSIRRHSNDRREVDYSTSGTSNTYQRSVTDNRRHYTDSHESRSYESRDPRENRGNLYGQNWRHPVQNRTHPYQHNPHKRNDRGGYSNWRWPGSNNYSHYRQSNNWR